MHLVGGVGLSSTETLDTRAASPSWQPGPDLPSNLGRACMVSTGSGLVVTGGHTNTSAPSLSTVLQLGAEADQWQQMEDMGTPRC